MRIIIATLKSWNINSAKEFKKKYSDKIQVKILTQREQLTQELLEEYTPEYVFFPHWSYMIPREIYERFNCVVFHMTDLPYGRGGSPLQNLIVRGIKETKISALKVVGELDAGPIYIKEPLSLEGSAEEIFIRASNIVFDKMIPYILETKPIPLEQTGEPVVFKRRIPDESKINPDLPVNKIYDYIRMLDAEGYPNAFIDFGEYRIEFSNAKLTNEQVEANAVIRRK